ncbi:MAG: hypothetical protein ACO1OB_13605 [Archangium sp.]
MRRRGAAAVETAVTTIVLVPLILYTLFLEDLLYYRLENQEPTIVAGWDYLTNNYMKAGDKRDIGRLNRLKYCDHTAAYDSYEQPYDCTGTDTGPSGNEDSGGGSQSYDVGGSAGGNDRGHHNATAAHQCWIVEGGADQVRCTVSKGNDATLFREQAAVLYSQSGWNQGGTVQCNARLGVMNYMLPNKVWGLMGMTGSGSDKAISSKGRNNAGAGDSATFDQIQSKTSDTSVHADKSNTANAWILRQESFGVMADPWALNLVDEKVEPSTGSPITSFIKPGQIPGQDIHHPLLDRSGHYYNDYMKDGNKAAKDYFDQMTDFLQDSMVFGANMDGLGPLGGDKPDTLPVYWDKDVQRSNNGGKASGYEDSRQAQASSGRSEYPW